MADFLSSRQELPVHPLISSDPAFYKAAVWLSVRSVQHDSSSVRATWAAARSVAVRSLPVFPRNYVQASNATTVLDEGVAVTGS